MELSITSGTGLSLLNCHLELPLFVGASPTYAFSRESSSVTAVIRLTYAGSGASVVDSVMGSVEKDELSARTLTASPRSRRPG